MERKQFIKSCGFACLGGLFLSSVLEGCAASRVVTGIIENADLVVPESARTWVIFGSDKGQITKTVLAATEAAPVAGKLQSRTDLAAMKDGKYAGASYTTL